MKNYIKPTIEFVELRPEEGLANCGSGGGGKNCSAGSRRCRRPSHFHR